MTEAEKQVTDETRELIVSLDEKQTKLTEYQPNIVNISKYASDLHTCLAVKQIEKDVETQDTCIQTIVKGGSLNQTKPIIQDGQRSEDYNNQHSKVWRSTF